MKQVGLAELTSSVQAPSSGRMGVDYTHILRAFSGWRSQSEALPGGSEVCNNSHCFIRSTVFNLDKCTAWQRTAEWVGVRVGVAPLSALKPSALQVGKLWSCKL